MLHTMKEEFTHENGKTTDRVYETPHPDAAMGEFESELKARGFQVVVKSDGFMSGRRETCDRTVEEWTITRLHRVGE